MADDEHQFIPDAPFQGWEEASRAHLPIPPEVASGDIAPVPAEVAAVPASDTLQDSSGGPPTPLGESSPLDESNLEVVAGPNPAPATPGLPQGIENFLAATQLVHLPGSFAGADAACSFRVSVEKNHSVVTILLLKAEGSEGGKDIEIGPERLSGGDKKFFDEYFEPGLKAGQALQAEIQKGGEVVSHIANFLSGQASGLLARMKSLECVPGPGKKVLGYYVGDTFVQFVVTVAFLTARGVRHFFARAPFPFAPGGVDAYVLPRGADFSAFAKYLAAKAKVGWQGQAAKFTRDVPREKLALAGTVGMYGGAAVGAYVALAILVGALAPHVWSLLAGLAPVAAGTIAIAVLVLAQRARLSGRELNDQLFCAASWRHTKLPKLVAQRVAGKFEGDLRVQFLAEVDREAATAEALKVLKAKRAARAKEPVREKHAKIPPLPGHASDIPAIREIQEASPQEGSREGAGEWGGWVDDFVEDFVDDFVDDLDDAAGGPP